MSAFFKAQSLVETNGRPRERRFEMTFVDATGQRQIISLPAAVAADLVPVLQSLAAGLDRPGGIHFTRKPKLMAVGSAKHERLVLIRFDDEAPYGLPVEEARSLGQQVKEEAEQVSRLRAPMRQ
jgi:hypothetical protein